VLRSSGEEMRAGNAAPPAQLCFYFMMMFLQSLASARLLFLHHRRG